MMPSCILYACCGTSQLPCQAQESCRLMSLRSSPAGIVQRNHQKKHILHSGGEAINRPGTLPLSTTPAGPRSSAAQTGWCCPGHWALRAPTGRPRLPESPQSLTGNTGRDTSLDAVRHSFTIEPLTCWPSEFSSPNRMVLPGSLGPEGTHRPPPECQEAPKAEKEHQQGHLTRAPHSARAQLCI